MGIYITSMPTDLPTVSPGVDPFLSAQNISTGTITYTNITKANDEDYGYMLTSLADLYDVPIWHTRIENRTL
eukprot:UN00704